MAFDLRFWSTEIHWMMKSSELNKSCQEFPSSFLYMQTKISFAIWRPSASLHSILSLSKPTPYLWHPLRFNPCFIQREFTFHYHNLKSFLPLTTRFCTWSSNPSLSSSIKHVLMKLSISFSPSHWIDLVVWSTGSVHAKMNRKSEFEWLENLQNKIWPPIWPTTTIDCVGMLVLAWIILALWLGCK